MKKKKLLAIITAALMVTTTLTFTGGAIAYGIEQDNAKPGDAVVSQADVSGEDEINLKQSAEDVNSGQKDQAADKEEAVDEEQADAGSDGPKDSSSNQPGGDRTDSNAQPGGDEEINVNQPSEDVNSDQEDETNGETPAGDDSDMTDDSEQSGADSDSNETDGDGNLPANGNQPGGDEEINLNQPSEDVNSEKEEKIPVNITVRGFTKTVKYNGMEQYFQYIPWGWERFMEISCDRDDFDLRYLGCSYVISGKHVGEYGRALTAGDFYIAGGWTSDGTSYRDKFEIGSVTCEAAPKLVITKAKITVWTPSVEKEYAPGEELSTYGYHTARTDINWWGTMPWFESYVVEDYTKVTEPTEEPVENAILIALGMFSFKNPGQFIDYDEFLYEISGGTEKRYFRDNYDIEYNYGTLWLRNFGGSGGGDTPGDDTGDDPNEDPNDNPSDDPNGDDDDNGTLGGDGDDNDGGDTTKGGGTIDNDKGPVGASDKNKGIGNSGTTAVNVKQSAATAAAQAGISNVFSNCTISFVNNDEEVPRSNMNNGGGTNSGGSRLPFLAAVAGVLAAAGAGAAAFYKIRDMRRLAQYDKWF